MKRSSDAMFDDLIAESPQNNSGPDIGKMIDDRMSQAFEKFEQEFNKINDSIDELKNNSKVNDFKSKVEEVKEKIEAESQEPLRTEVPMDGTL